ncbi:MAG TPA: hypothetical protein VGE98_03095, partial [Thermoanaerobaculia bacterium]
KLYASDDGGKHWEQRFSLDGIFYSGGGGIATSTQNPSLVMFGGVLGFRSTDGGRTFQQIQANYYTDPEHQPHFDFDGFDVATWNGRETIFANTDGGTWASQDGGATFENVTLRGFPDSQYYSSYTNPKNPDQIAVGSQDQGLQVSYPQPGVMAFVQQFGGDYGSLTSSSGGFKNLFASYYGGLVYWSDPTVASTARIFPSPLTHHAFFEPLIADPKEPTSVYVAGDHIWRLGRLDLGPRFTKKQMPHDFSSLDGKDYVTGFAISRADSAYWYAATHEGALWASRDHGVTWSGPQKVEASYAALFVLASPTDPRTCFVAGRRGETAVYKTTDGGATWQPLAHGQSPTTVSALAFDSPSSQTLYAASADGPFRYDPGSDSWVSLLSGAAPLTQYLGVESVPSIGVVRFSTYGRGIWDYRAASGSTAPPPPPVPTVCTPGPQTLCLVGGRFQVQATWQNQFDGSSGAGGAIPRTDESGFFSFNDPANVELIVKILVFDSGVKVFYGELTDLHFTLTVSDTRTGTVKTYTNTPGDCGAIDQTAFPKSAVGKRATRASREGASARQGSAVGTCRPGTTELCLANRRYALSVDWANSGAGASGKAGAVRLASDLTGAFYFTDPSNLELLVKVLDLGDRVAVFYGSLSNLEFTLQVTDTVSGQAKTYHNPAGTFCGGLDNQAFPQ